MQESSPITAVKGVGEKTAEYFGKAGIYTVGDLIRYYPRAYDKPEPPRPVASLSGRDERSVVAIQGALTRELSVRFFKSMKVTTGTVRDPSGAELNVTWYNMPYLRSQLHPGTRYVFRGTFKKKGRQYFLQQSKVYDLFDYAALTKTLQPVYTLRLHMTLNALRKALKDAFYGADHLDLTEDALPEDIIRRNDLESYGSAVRTIHFPASEEHLERARRRLVFDEFFYFVLMIRQMKGENAADLSAPPLADTSDTEKVISSLPYQLTGAQKRVWAEVSKDLSGRKPASRLIQGDVGSGKTIIAFLALIKAAADHMQGALMAPTEVLARQHYEAFQKLCERAGLPYRAVLLTGSLKAAERREALSAIENGEADTIIGTQALIQEKVAYHSLAVVITDEQHRFGVRQRETFAQKGASPHMIVMSATPIPRTLAVILYGDLDVSKIDELPANRKKIKNAVVDTAWRPKAYAFIQKEVKAGHQAYVICPMVDDSGETEAENVVDYTEELRSALPDVRIEYLHGKMKNAEKNSIMERFASGEIQVLVSTTVVEVGVNVPNATVMMIENSERFGLASLHQLRGRVGRGDAQSYAIFMHTASSEAIEKRLNVLRDSNDGFEIAGKDLEMRGPGELFGVRQSGELTFPLTDIYGDADLMNSAAQEAKEILENDPKLSDPEHEDIRRHIQKLRDIENTFVIL